MEEEKNKGGRPLKFESPEQIQVLIDEYFDQCDEKEEPYTITGIALALNCDRETLTNYTKRDEFFDTIKIAKLRVENYLEKCLYRPAGVTGLIFNLKVNFHWPDSFDLKHGLPDNSLPKKITVEFVDSDEDSDTA